MSARDHIQTAPAVEPSHSQARPARPNGRNFPRSSAEGSSRFAVRTIDDETRAAIRTFLRLIAPKHRPVDALLYGSRARGTHRVDSDADLAVVLDGRRGDRASVGMDMAAVAADVLVATGVLISPLPIWRCELRQPERFGNPALIEAIRREGLRPR